MGIGVRQVTSVSLFEYQERCIKVRKLRLVLIAILLSILILSTTSGRFLVLNDLQQADVIVVLAGESYVDLAYHPGMDQVAAVVAGGEIVRGPALP